LFLEHGRICPWNILVDKSLPGIPLWITRGRRMDKELEQRIARYKILKAANIPQDQIAREMRVTTRPQRRWSNVEISPELEAEVDAISQQHREMDLPRFH